MPEGSYVSRKHAKIACDGDAWTITDLGSSNGTFVLRDKGERVGRNPKTGVEVPIAPRRVLTFRASQMMRDRIVAAG